MLRFIWQTPTNRIGLIAYTIFLLVMTPIVAIVSISLIDGKPACDVPILVSAVYSLYSVPYFILLLILSINYQPGTSIFRFRIHPWELVALIGVIPGIVLYLGEVSYWLGLRYWPVSVMYFLTIHPLLILRTMISIKKKPSAPEQERLALPFLDKINPLP